MRMRSPLPNPTAKGPPASPVFGERFTHRLEAFSDLVFGFSLSLLATRLDVPANVSEVFDPTRWGTFLVTFGMICILWLAHYRIFRARFVVQTPDVIINFVFLLGIAVLPYAVQTFLRFTLGRNAIVLYFGDFALVFAALATLRWRALRQRRGHDDREVRLREWRSSVRQYTIVLIIVGFLIGTNGKTFPNEKLLALVPAVLITVTLFARVAVRRLPAFLE